jgi:hypothetical protein
MYAYLSAFEFHSYEMAIPWTGLQSSNFEHPCKPGKRRVRKGRGGEKKRKSQVRRRQADRQAGRREAHSQIGDIFFANDFPLATLFDSSTMMDVYDG